MDLNNLKAMIKPGDVKAAMDVAQHSWLVDNDSEQHAINAAACWGYACMQAHRIVHELDDDAHEVMRMALVKRTVYELGLTSLEFTEYSEHNKDDADVLMDAVLNGA